MSSVLAYDNIIIIILRSIYYVRVCLSRYNNTGSYIVIKYLSSSTCSLQNKHTHNTIIFDIIRYYGTQICTPHSFIDSFHSVLTMDLVLPSAERGARSFPIGGKTWIAGLAVVFVTCILPFFILAFLPVWNVYRRRRRLRDEAQRRALASKVAKTIRESYILRLTEDYSTVSGVEWSGVEWRIVVCGMQCGLDSVLA